MTFVDVILPLPLPQYYTYGIPFDRVAEVEVGKRVVVQFGKSKMYTALVRRMHSQAPAAYTPKPIDSVIDEYPIVTEIQMLFWEWLAQYYMCTVGEVMAAALPAGLKLSSETMVVANMSSDQDFSNLDDDAYIVAEALQARPELSIKDIQDLLEKKTVYPIIRQLLEERFVFVKQELQERYKPKLDTFVRLNKSMKKEANLREVFDSLERAPKQLELLMRFLQVEKQEEHILRADIIKQAEASSAQMKSLIEKGILNEYEMEVSRLGMKEIETTANYELTPLQAIALGEIDQHFKDKNVVLLHGVTSSGKTLLYIEKIKEALSKGKQVLYLLPEIALTAQLVQRLEKVFGNKVGVYHSKFNNHERVEIWQKVYQNDYQLLIGARSALFLPFRDLDLIIVDEEHDGSFKQFDPAPRYNARDAAIVLANYHKAKVLLGSGSPAISSYANAQAGKYGLVELSERYGGIELPEIQVVDLKEEYKFSRMKSYFSQPLHQAIEQALEKQEQVILFQNRRGYSQFMVCSTCGWVPHCHQCDVSLTYHRFSSKVACHYCGFSKQPPTHCEACGSNTMQVRGYGTEKIEDELGILFPTARVDRLDLDSTRAKHGHEEIIHRFERRDIDILVGTQMVTKGLDFDHVSLVGIVNADQLIRFPHYKAHERAFQLMMQVSGRAGRRQTRGRVIVQSFEPEHPVLSYVVNHNYSAFYSYEMYNRHEMHYPPFVRMIQIGLKHKEAAKVEQASRQLAANLRGFLGGNVLGPAVPPVSRIKNYYLRDILIKLPKGSPIDELKQQIQHSMDQLSAQSGFKSLRYHVDVDP